MTPIIDHPTRGTACPPVFELDLCAVGDAPGLEAHVSGCAACTAYVTQVRGYDASFRKARPAERFVRQVDAWRPPSTSRRWWWVGALVPVALAALFFFSGPSPGPEVIEKGGAFHVFIKRGAAEPVPATMEQAVRAGDRVRFAYDAPRDGHLVIFELDGADHVEVLSSDANARLAGARLVDGAFELDDTPGPEWFIAVFSPESIDVEALASQLTGQATRATVELRCPSCVVETLRLRKESK